LLSAILFEGGRPQRLLGQLEERSTSEGVVEFRFSLTEPVEKIELIAFRDLATQLRETSGATVVSGIYPLS